LSLARNRRRERSSRKCAKRIRSASNTRKKNGCHERQSARGDVMPNSTRNLRRLPDVDGLRTLLQSLAMLDAILCPEWDLRYYSFNSRWSKGKQMGSMRNGSGDDFFALFNASGCFLKGFDHESPMTPYDREPKEVWPGVLDDVPSEFDAALN